MKIFTVVTTTIATFIGVLVFIDSRVEEKLHTELAPVVADMSDIKKSVTRLESVYFSDKDGTVAHRARPKILREVRNLPVN